MCKRFVECCEIKLSFLDNVVIKTSENILKASDYVLLQRPSVLYVCSFFLESRKSMLV